MQVTLEVTALQKTATDTMSLGIVMMLFSGFSIYLSGFGPWNLSFMFLGMLFAGAGGNALSKANKLEKKVLSANVTNS